MSESGQPGAATPGEHDDGTGQQDDLARSVSGWAPATGWSGGTDAPGYRESASPWNRPDPTAGWGGQPSRHGDLPAPFPVPPAGDEVPRNGRAHRNGHDSAPEFPAPLRRPVSAPPGGPGHPADDPGFTDGDRLVVPAQRPASPPEPPHDPESARHSSDDPAAPRRGHWPDSGLPTSAPPAVQVPPVGTAASGFEVPPGFHAPERGEAGPPPTDAPRDWSNRLPVEGGPRGAGRFAPAEPTAGTEQPGAEPRGADPYGTDPYGTGPRGAGQYSGEQSAAGRRPAPGADEPDWSGPSWNRPSWGGSWAPAWSWDEEPPAGRPTRAERTAEWSAEPARPYEPVRAEPARPYQPVRAEPARPYEPVRSEVPRPYELTRSEPVTPPALPEPAPSVVARPGRDQPPVAPVVDRVAPGRPGTDHPEPDWSDRTGHDRDRPERDWSGRTGRSERDLPTRTDRPEGDFSGRSERDFPDRVDRSGRAERSERDWTAPMKRDWTDRPEQDRSGRDWTDRSGRDWPEPVERPDRGRPAGESATEGSPTPDRPAERRPWAVGPPADAPPVPPETFTGPPPAAPETFAGLPRDEPAGLSPTSRAEPPAVPALPGPEPVGPVAASGPERGTGLPPAVRADQPFRLPRDEPAARPVGRADQPFRLRSVPTEPATPTDPPGHPPEPPVSAVGAPATSGPHRLDRIPPAPVPTSAPPYAARRSAPDPLTATEPVVDERQPDRGTAVLPQRVPAEPDVPVVPEPPAVEPPAETPELARIATHLRRDDEPAPLRERPEGFDVNAILDAVREVAGVRDAALRRTPAGAHSLRLDLSDGADPAEVSRLVARLLQERMGLAAAPQNLSGEPSAPVPPPLRRRTGEPRPAAGERPGDARGRDEFGPADRRDPNRGGAPTGRARAVEPPAASPVVSPSAAAPPVVASSPVEDHPVGDPARPAGEPTARSTAAARADGVSRADGPAWDGEEHPAEESPTASGVPRRRRQPVHRGRASVEEAPPGALLVPTGSPATLNASYSGGQMTTTETAPSRPLDTGGVPGPRVVIDHVQVSTFGLDANVEVRLLTAGEPAAGHATGPAVDGYVLRLCAVAAAAAVDELLRHAERTAERGRCFVEHAAVVPFGNCEVATVVVLLVCDGWVEQLAGSALVAGDPRQAVVRATLAAVNRRLEALLA
ncbi:hypothetical protein AB0B63_17370 [Micromonospora sp. NPDC049081]|uniref:hypothetical protein n=1 Tax=Micromonospora sp. NPDC049081 TaxID=3155150 RepID=UPI00340C94B5